MRGSIRSSGRCAVAVAAFVLLSGTAAVAEPVRGSEPRPAECERLAAVRTPPPVAEPDYPRSPDWKPEPVTIETPGDGAVVDGGYLYLDGHGEFSIGVSIEDTDGTVLTGAYIRPDYHWQAVLCTPLSPGAHTLTAVQDMTKGPEYLPGDAPEQRSAPVTITVVDHGPETPAIASPPPGPILTDECAPKPVPGTADA